MTDASGPVRVVLLGCGTVGSEVARALTDPEVVAGLSDAVGAPLELVGVAVSRPGAERAGVDPALVTTDAAELLRTARSDVVVELIGAGREVPSLLRQAIDGGASVVTSA